MLLAVVAAVASLVACREAVSLVVYRHPVEAASPVACRLPVAVELHPLKYLPLPEAIAV
jgi:hypothetical protein